MAISPRIGSILMQLARERGTLALDRDGLIARAFNREPEQRDRLGSKRLGLDAADKTIGTDRNGWQASLGGATGKDQQPITATLGHFADLIERR